MEGTSETGVNHFCEAAAEVLPSPQKRLCPAHSVTWCLTHRVSPHLTGPLPQQPGRTEAWMRPSFRFFSLVWFLQGPQLPPSLRLARIIKPAPRWCKTRAAWVIRLMQPTVFVGRPHWYLLCKAPGGLIKHKWFTLRGDVMAGGSHLLMAPPGLKPLPHSRALPPLLTIMCTIGAVCGSKELQLNFPHFRDRKILSFLFLF